MDPDTIKEREGEGKMAQDEDMFDETFQYESQMMHAVDSIEKKHCNNNLNRIGEATMTALCSEEDSFSSNSNSNKSNSKTNRPMNCSNRRLKEITNEINNDKSCNQSPLFSSTPSTSTSSVETNFQFVTARKLIETSEEFRHVRAELSQPPSPAIEDSRLDLSGWGLPDCVVESYREKGIRRMFPWQVECLTVDNGAVLSGANLVYSAPTSAGKTLVAEILLMKKVFETGKKALLILPFVSLAREKMFHLQNLLREAGIRVEGFMGSQSPAGGLKSTDIGVATIEKANSLVNRLLEEGKLSTLSCVVVDELHMLGDPSRGYLLELLLTKILYVAGDSIQIIGMSATLPNLSDLSRWLRGSLYTTSFRPVPLTELIKIGSTLLSTDLKPVGAVTPRVRLAQDTEHITWLCLQTILESHSVLVFCPMKAWVENLAETVANDFFSLGRPDPHDRDEDSVAVREGLQAQLSGDNLSEILEQLSRCPAGLDRTLARVIRMGVAFHHAGLTTDERDIVEAGFKNGIIRVLVATSTLSSGVNLPARRVIIRCPLTYNNKMMDKLQYKQMVGRAGRKGVDTEGESILICKPTERERVSVLVTGDTERVVSCLAGSSNRLASSMKRALLEVIVSGAAVSVLDVERYANCTLLATQLTSVSITDCVQFLLEAEFIRLQENNYVATRLGLACLASSLAPDEGLAVYAELSKARKQFVLENELHIIYLIVPIYAAVSWPNLDWMGFLDIWNALSEDMKRVGTLVGVEERWILRAMRGTVRTTDPEQKKCLAIHQRFYTALALHDLVDEMPLSQVASKYGATKGMLQSLQQAASTFSGMVTVFCDRLGWGNLELLVGQFQSRMEFGVQRELVDLCKLLSVDGARARMLYNAGIVSVASLATAKPGDVENILHTNTAFYGADTKNEPGGKKIKNIFIVGLPPMTEEECARIMVEEARKVLQRDLGLSEAAWTEANPLQQRPVKLVVTPQHQHSRTPAMHSRSSSGKKRKSSLKVSPHLKYQLETTKPTSLSQRLQRDQVSPEQRDNRTVAKPGNPSPDLKKVDFPVEVSNKTELEEDQKEILNVEPSTEKPVNTVEEEEDMFELSESFDMSSVMENIFVDEVETAGVPRTKKRVSWGDDQEGSLCTEKLMTPEEKEEEVEEVVEVEKSFVPKTPRFKVCSEDLELHWSDSDTDSVCVVEEDEKIINTTGNTSTEEFGESISDSVFNAVMSKHEENDVGLEMSEGMLVAMDCLDSQVSFSEVDMVETSPQENRGRRKRRKLTQLDEANASNSKDDIFCDSDSDLVPGEGVSEAEGEGEGRLCVVDVCSNREVFTSFKSELKLQTEFSLAVAVSRLDENTDKEPSKNVLIVELGVVVGVAISWSQLQCFYIQLDEDIESPDDSLTPPDDEISISLDERLSLIRSLLCRPEAVVAASDFKYQANLLYSVTGEVVRCRASDPLVAGWMLDPTASQNTLNRLLLDLRPDLSHLLTTLGSAPGYGSVSANPGASQPARYRAVAEAVIVNIVESRLRDKLESMGLLEHYQQVEMNCQKILVKMELCGMGINEREYQDTRLLLDARMKIIEDTAYKMAGRHFSLSSPPDICKVLYTELKMPPNGDPKLSSCLPGRGGRGGVKLSSSKEILEKLVALDYKLPSLILEHRRLSSAISKTLTPLLSVCQPHPVLSGPRVYSRSITNTSTGRVSLQEPNMQNIPKDFHVEVTSELRRRALGRRSSRRRTNNSSLALTPLSRLLSPLEPSTTVSLRLAVTPTEGNILLSADYSQLELRILAHLSADSTLIQTLSEGQDVFRAMAGQINNCEEGEVTDLMRQQAKQIVYGVIYGIGDKTLSDQLGVDTSEAMRFMEKFKSKYPGVRTFMQECIVSARKTGHVQTLSGRRRQLADIHHSSIARRGAAERQSINTRVQGSAADLVKVAMVNIDKKIEEVWPQCRPLKFTRARGVQWRPEEMTGAWLVLQLHDELIYEVSGEEVLQAARIVKEGMEEALDLSVPTPVRIKVGTSWGELQDFRIEEYVRLKTKD